MQNGKDERDDFWNLEKLIPKRQAASPFKTRNAVYDFSEEGKVVENEVAKSESTRLTVPYKQEDAASFEYTPSNNSLIKRVRIIKRQDKYDFYESFRSAAKVNFDCRGAVSDFVQFYSYLPQYSQLTPSQKSYYFYFRSEVRSGRYIKSDYSYLYLLVYEIINLPDLIPPDKGIKLLITLWREYRGRLPRIDLYFNIWVRDYCLVHKLEFPISEVSDFIFDIVSVSQLKEFYLSYYKEAGEIGLLSMLAYLSDYDYRRGKFKDGNPSFDPERRKRQAEMYRTHIKGALSELLREAVDLFDSSRGGSTAVYRFDAFQNTVCTHSVKCTVEVEYYKLAEASHVREGITAAVRYAENRLRALMGIKSRLAVEGLPDAYKYVLDGYFDALYRRERAERERESAPAYEQLYYAAREELSSANADEIETLSWDTTARLTEFSDEDAPDTCFAEDVQENGEKETLVIESEPPSDSFGLDRECIEFIDALFQNNRSFGLDAGSLAERVNEAFADGFGDVIIEFDGASYSIIEDYREDVENWLKTHR